MNNNYYYEFGYNYFGPLLVNFNKWLLSNLSKYNIDRVYFLARDGFVVKKIFDKINNTQIKSYYLYASRRACIVPTLFKIENSFEIFDKITISNKVSLETLIKKIGLDDIDLKFYLDKYDLSTETVVNKSHLSNEIICFLDEILPLVKNNAEEEYKCMIKYLNNKKFSGKVAIVDIGWHGTMQEALKKVSNNDIYGFYFGTISKFDNKKEFGYLFNDISEKNYYKVKNFLSLFEFLFLAQEGSAKKYDNTNKMIELYEYEYTKLNEQAIVQSIQEGAFEFSKNIVDFNENKVKERFMNYFLYPSLKTAEMFGNLYFYDVEKKKIANSESIINYLVSPKKFKGDYLMSSWRIGFLKRTFKLYNNYFLLNKLIRNIFLRNNITIENEKIINKVMTSKIISFDIYDTLIKRRVSLDFDRYMEIEKKNCIKGFTKKRIEAEKNVRKKYPKNEISIYQIYEEMNYDRCLSDRLMSDEIQFEKDTIFINKNIKEILDFCHFKNKRIIITSDMYLSKKTIEEILKSNNIYYDKLYLSSDLNLTKSSGKIFDYIKKKEHVHYRDILHIGDNKKSDFIRPKMKGIRCILVK